MWSNTHKHCHHPAGKGTHQINLTFWLGSRAGLWMLGMSYSSATMEAASHGNGVPGMLAQLGKGVWAP